MTRSRFCHCTAIVFTHTVHIDKAETAYGSNTKQEDQIRTTVLKVVLSYPQGKKIG